MFINKKKTIFNNVRIERPKLTFIIVNIIVSSLGFIRSFVFMRVLDFHELGILTIIQTMIMLISMFQFGLINGGYRIFSLDKKEDNERINNLIFSYLLILMILFGVILFILSYFNLSINYIFLVSAFGIGLISLLCNWLSNTLIAKQLIKELNGLNLFTAVISFAALPLAFYYKINGAILVLVIQPLLFVTLSLYRRIDLRPTCFIFNWTTIKWILKYGFIPFLTGIMGLINIQIERWSIVNWLSTEDLGRFYLVFLFSTLFILIPNSINSLLFPNSMKLYASRNFSLLIKSISNYYKLLLVYIFITVVLTVFLMPTIITYLLPKHSQSISYVFYILPGLCLLILVDPISLIFNAAFKLRPIFWAYFTSIIVNVILISLCVKLEFFTLTSMSILRSIIGAYVFIFFIISYYLFRKEIWT
jgi:O-antigen/teichoic acid export membrane protein